MSKRRFPRGSTYRCGHDRTKANTIRTRSNGDLCRLCKLSYLRLWRANQKEKMATPPLPTVTIPDPQDSIALYRAEKAKRASQSNPVMESAKVAYAQLLRDTAPQRTGRPRGSKNNAWADLSDLLSEQSA